MHARFVSLQPLQHLDPPAHAADVQNCNGAGLRARRPGGSRGVAAFLKLRATVFGPKEYITSLPKRPGVYRMFGAGHELLYVGKARSLRDRVGTYFAAGNVNPKVQALVQQITAIEVTVTNSETEALLLEYNLIKAHKPRFNVVLRDDKSFPYIHLCVEHEFPRLVFYRGARSAPGRYFGPFPNAGAVRDTLNQLQKLFRIRNCRDSFFANRSRPCLQHQIGRCSAPCVALITREAYAQDMAAAVKVLDGRSDEVNAELQARMGEVGASMQFERAAQIRDQLAALKRIQAQQVVTAEGHRDVDVFAIVGEAGEDAASGLLVGVPCWCAAAPITAPAAAFPALRWPSRTRRSPLSSCSTTRPPRPRRRCCSAAPWKTRHPWRSCSAAAPGMRSKCGIRCAAWRYAGWSSPGRMRRRRCACASRSARAWRKCSPVCPRRSTCPSRRRAWSASISATPAARAPWRRASCSDRRVL